jgi:multiple RNA-binding domain-containing protein 1
MVTQTKITFEDSDDELYDNLPTSKADNSEDIEDIEDTQMSETPQDDTPDMDWLKSRMTKAPEETTDEVYAFNASVVSRIYIAALEMVADCQFGNSVPIGKARR